MNSSELLALTGGKTRSRFDASPLVAFLGSVAVAVSLFLPWMGIKLSQCIFTLCGSTGTQGFSVVQIAGTGVLLNLLGGPFTSLIPVATSYTLLALWCVGALVFGVIFAGWRVRRSKTRWKRLASFLWSLVQLALVGGTVFQMQQTFALQNKASVSFVHVTPASYLQQGTLALLIGLSLLSLAAILGIARPKR